VRILHIDTGREMRGGQRQVLLLMNGLREAGHECHLMARQGAPLWGAAELAGFAVRTATFRNLWLESNQAGITHAHDGHAHSLAVLSVRKPFVVSRRVAFPVSRSLASRWKYRRPSRFIAVSQFVAGELEQAGVPPEKIDIVFDGVEPVTAVTEWRADFPAVALASYDPQKGRDLVEQAVQAAQVPIVYSNDLAHDLERASVFVYITRSEGLGSAALLAMSMGVPVIASRVGGLPETVRHGETGILVENDPPEIAHALRKLLKDPVLAHALIEQAKRQIGICFSQRHLVEATLASYRRAIAG
jgi:glycosyltransferase involved in cell wall biosynthesis